MTAALQLSTLLRQQLTKLPPEIQQLPSSLRLYNRTNTSAVAMAMKRAWKRRGEGWSTTCLLEELLLQPACLVVLHGISLHLSLVIKRNPPHLVGRRVERNRIDVNVKTKIDIKIETKYR